MVDLLMPDPRTTAGELMNALQWLIVERARKTALLKKLRQREEEKWNRKRGWAKDVVEEMSHREVNYWLNRLRE